VASGVDLEELVSKLNEEPAFLPTLPPASRGRMESFLALSPII
jgi:hypothetical protein